MQGQLPGAAVAVAGKQLRGSHDRSAELPALHMVSAWATAQGLTLGQVAVDDKANEITALPAPCCRYGMCRGSPSMP